jgi:hypothetical protein
MKVLMSFFILTGVVLLLGALIGRLVGNPHIFVGVRVLNLIILSNNAFSLAILIKLFEKK